MRNFGVNVDDNQSNFYDYLPMKYLEDQMLAQSSLAQNDVRGNADMLYMMMLDQNIFDQELDQNK